MADAEATPKQLDATDLQLLEACLRNPEASQKQLAEALGLSLRTTNRRINQPHFREALHRKYNEQVEIAVQVYRANAPRVARALAKIIHPGGGCSTCGRGALAAEPRDIIGAAREMNRMLESKPMQGAFNLGAPAAPGAPMTVTTPVDLSTLTDEELIVVAKMFRVDPAQLRQFTREEGQQ